MLPSIAQRWPALRPRHGLWLVGLLVLMWSTTPSRAQAQTPFFASQLAVGSGITWGNGPGDQTVSRRTPMFVDASLRTWSDESPTLHWGGSLRIELEGRTSLGIVPRVELAKKLGSLTIAPGAGVPLFFAPFSMVGVEVSTRVHMPLSDTLGVSATALFDGYFFGSDVPENSAVIMFNLMLGATLVL